MSALICIFLPPLSSEACLFNHSKRDNKMKISTKGFDFLPEINFSTDKFKMRFLSF